MVHGDAPVTELFSEDAAARDSRHMRLLYEEVYDLLDNKKLAEGVVRQRKQTTGGAGCRPLRPTSVWRRLAG